VLDPSHLWLTIHESVGHPLELDRVLGYEANFAGTSFATLDKWQSKNFKYGSPQVTLFADKLQEGSLGAVGWDDEGVKTKRWDLVKDGTLVNYQAIRDQAHIIGEPESHGCCYADSWSNVQFQRMPNVSLAAGKAPLSVNDLIKDVKRASTSSVMVRSPSTSNGTTSSSAASCSTRSKTDRLPACSRTWPTSRTRRNSGTRACRCATRKTTASAARFSTARASPPSPVPSPTAAPRPASTA
jgi:predicted Zn-dependent protease